MTLNELVKLTTLWTTGPRSMLLYKQMTNIVTNWSDCFYNILIYKYPKTGVYYFTFSHTNTIKLDGMFYQHFHTPECMSLAHVWSVGLYNLFSYNRHRAGQKSEMLTVAFLWHSTASFTVSLTLDGITSFLASFTLYKQVNAGIIIKSIGGDFFKQWRKIGRIWRKRHHFCRLLICSNRRVNKGKCGRNLHLKVSGASVPSVQESRDWLPLLIQIHYLLLTLLYAHMFWCYTNLRIKIKCVWPRSGEIRTRWGKYGQREGKYGLHYKIHITVETSYIKLLQWSFFFYFFFLFFFFFFFSCFFFFFFCFFFCFKIYGSLLFSGKWKYSWECPRWNKTKTPMERVIIKWTAGFRTT